MVESIVLGIIQGIAEWLPISSEGLLILAKVRFFGGGDVKELINYAMFLHLGTFFAALIYFRKAILLLIKALFKYRTAKVEVRKLLNFYILATAISGAVGLAILMGIRQIDGDSLLLTGRGIVLLISTMLLITAFLQLGRKKEGGYRKIANLEKKDSLILGVAQGLSIVPGLSRSGLTVSAFLLRKFDDAAALKMSFLMSLPVILGGNIYLNFNQSFLTIESLIGLALSFIVGIFTIHILLKIAKKLNFGWFVLLFAGIMILSVFI